MLRLKNQTAEIIINSFTENGGLTLYVPLDTDLGELRAAVQASDELFFYNIAENSNEEAGVPEEKLTAVLTGKFIFSDIAVNEDHIKIVFSKSENRLIKLEEAVTDIELALCDIYESMGV